MVGYRVSNVRVGGPPRPGPWSKCQTQELAQHRTRNQETRKSTAARGQPVKGKLAGTDGSSRHLLSIELTVAGSPLSPVPTSLVLTASL